MKVKDLTITDELKEIVQIGIVVEDIEKAKQGMLDVFGLSLIHISTARGKGGVRKSASVRAQRNSSLPRDVYKRQLPRCAPVQASA